MSLLVHSTFIVQNTHHGCINEEFQNFSAVMNVIEMEDRLCDPDLDLVVDFVQIFDRGGLAFRQMHDVVWRVQGTIVVSLEESKPNREVMGCNLRGLKGNTSNFRFESLWQSRFLDLIETILRQLP